MMPSASELQYFLEVGNTLNVSRAAERLGISQPTLSLAIKRLEDSFGVPLLIRNKSGVRLTHAGQRLITQSRALLNEWDKIRNDAIREESELRGRYVIGCHVSVALYTLPNFLPSLIHENPSLEVKLVHDLSRKITEDVISFKIDFGLVVNPWDHPDLVIKLLAQDEVSLWTGSKPSELQNPLSGEAVLICDDNLLQTQSILKQLEKQNINFKRIITSSNLEVVTALVAAGTGIGILPSRVAKRIKPLGLRPYSKNSPKFLDKICLVFRADVQHSKASRKIAHWIESSLLIN